MMSCREVAELSTEYLEGSLPFWRRMAVRMHLAMCRRCPAFMDQLRKTIELLGRLPPDPMPQETRAKLIMQFREANARTRRGGA
jgi:hypothetical protein